MNKKGFTIAEVLVTFVLVAFISMSLLQLLLNYKDLANVKMKQQTYAAIKDEITIRIQKDVKTRGLMYIKQASPNSIYFVFSDKPSEPVSLTVHNVNFIDSTVASEFGKASASELTANEKYTAINDKYIEYNGVKYPIPSGMPDLTSIPAYNEAATDFSKYMGVNINMGRIYYESTPYDLTPTITNESQKKYRTIYHVVVGLGVTDLDEDYGLDMIFVANSKGSNTPARNKVYNSSFENEQFYGRLQSDYNFVENQSDEKQITSDMLDHTCYEYGDIRNTATLNSDFVRIPAFDGQNEISCRCKENTPCSMTLRQLVKLEKGKTYTLSYYYYTNYGTDYSFDDETLKINEIFCNSMQGTTCKKDRDAGVHRIAASSITVEKNEAGVSQEGTEWRRFVYTFTMPDNENYPYLKLKFGSKPDANKSRIAIDAIQLEEGSAASTYQRT